MHIDQLITSAQERASSTLDQAHKSLYAVTSSFMWPHAETFEAEVPKLRAEPPAYTGNTNIAPDLLNAFNNAFAELSPVLQDALGDYLGTYYPECVRSSTDNWICDTILKGGTGLPAHIEQAIWERARAREIAEAVRLEDEATNAFAARGFTMPPGAMAGQIMRIQQEAANKSSTFSREQAIKSVEIELENIRFAIQQGVQIRSTVLGAIGSYLQAYSTPIEMAMKRAQMLADAQSRLWSSSADYYRAMVSEAQLGLEAQGITQRSQDSVNNILNSVLQSEVKRRTDAAMGVAKILGDMAQAANAGIITLASEETKAFQNT